MKTSILAFGLLHSLRKAILTKLSITALVLILSSLSSCCGPEDYSLTDSNSFGFVIRNKKNKENILIAGDTQYILDSVNVYNEQWKVPYGTFIRPDGYLGLYFITKDDRGKVNKTISKRFYMYFNYQDIDTIDIDFVTKYDECDFQKMKYFKVSYNDSVYYDGPSDETVPTATFYKAMN
jgi:hypothetical protein